MLLAIFELASEVAEGDLTALDSGLLRWMRGLTGEHGLAVDALRWITWLGNAPMLITVTALTCIGLLLTRRFGRATILLVGTLSGAGIVSLMKYVVARPRPVVVAHLTDYGDLSFPSGHAANSAIVYLAIAELVAQLVPGLRLRAAILSAAMLLAIAIGLSRLFLGVHWPTDVLAGWVFGASWALLCWTIGWWWRARMAHRGVTAR